MRFTRELDYIPNRRRCQYPKMCTAANCFDDVRKVSYNESVASGRGDRVADGAALEMRFTSNRDVGSNPTLSARKFCSTNFSVVSS